MSTASSLKSALDAALGSVPTALDTARGQITTAVGSSIDTVAAATVTTAEGYADGVGAATLSSANTHSDAAAAAAQSAAIASSNATTTAAIAALPAPTALLNGAGTPSGGTGANGDFYIDTTNQILYGPKTSGAWGSGVNIKGAGVRTGAGAPSGGLGSDGDFYIDTTAHTIYGPKASGSWGSSLSLVGAGVPAGGATGQVMTKNSGTDFDTAWLYPLWRIVTKAADQSAFSGFTDNTLVTGALVTATKYRFRALIFFTETAAVDVIYSITGPTLSACRILRTTQDASGGAGAIDLITALPATAHVTSDASHVGCVKLEGAFVTSGTTQLALVIGSNGGQSVTILAGSYIEWSAI